MAWLAVVGAIATALGGRAAAQPADAEAERDPHGIGAMREEHIADQEAHSHFRVGTTLYREGRFVEAAREFERAFGLSQRPSLRFNAYLAYRDAGDLENAVRNLGEYLALAPDAADHELLSRRLRAMEATLAEQRAEAEARAAERAALEAERQRLEEERRALAERAAPDSPAEAPERERRLAPFLVGGAGAGLVVASGITGLVARGRVRDLESACPGDVCFAGFDLEGARAEARRAAVATDVMLFTGLAAVTTGVILLVVGGDSDDPPPVTAGCGASGCGVDLLVSFR